MAACGYTNVHLARELLAVRLFVRTMIQADFVGPDDLLKALQRASKAPSFHRIMDEELFLTRLAVNSRNVGYTLRTARYTGEPLSLPDCTQMCLAVFHPSPNQPLSVEEVVELQSLKEETRLVIRALVRSGAGRVAVRKCLAKWPTLKTVAQHFREEDAYQECISKPENIEEMFNASKRPRPPGDIGPQQQVRKSRPTDVRAHNFRQDVFNRLKAASIDLELRL